MKIMYLITLPERVWHWLNAALFILLAVTGLAMHTSERIEGVNLGTLIHVHNVAATFFVINLGFWLVYELASGRIGNYFVVERDFIRRLIVQSKFYMFGIFKGEGHPYPPTNHSKFNPLQRITYLGLMFVLVPVQVATGVILYLYSQSDKLAPGFESFRTYALVHTAVSYLLLAFLVGHIYLATTGDRPLTLIISMITGYHAEEHEGEEA